MEILTVAQMREVERIANDHGLSYAQMMHNAGNAAAEVILQRFDHANMRDRARVLILVGSGNNGGDGLVCATALAQAGVTTQCYLLKPRDEDEPVFAAARAQGIFMADAQNDLRFRVLDQMVTHANVIVDALLGTGASRPIEGELQAILSEVALRRQGDRERGEQGDQPVTSSPCLLVGLDGPTGMDYDTGALDPAAVPADLTITLHAPKRGHYCFPAAQARGKLIIAPIGIERFSIRSQSKIENPKLKVELADDAMIRVLLPSRKLDANKGTFGRAVIAGGSNDYIGAPALSATAAYRVGAGLVALAVPAEVKQAAAQTCREAIFVPLVAPLPDASHLPVLDASAARSILDFVSKLKDGAAVLIGPGMGQSDATARFMDAITQDDGLRALQLKGLVCDADALNQLAKMADWHARLPSTTILTPHAGEMARLAGTSIAEIQGDRIGNALRYAQAWGHVVVLKGAYTVVAAPDLAGRAVVMPFSNPAMATAGTGDVLAGSIVGLLAQGLSPFDAAVGGAYLHGAAGEQWRTMHGDAGMLASDLPPILPDVIHALSH